MTITFAGKTEWDKISEIQPSVLLSYPKEVRAVLERSKSFSIERMEILKSGALLSIDGYVACFRAAHENMFSHKFGAENVDKIF